LYQNSCGILILHHSYRSKNYEKNGKCEEFKKKEEREKEAGGGARSGNEERFNYRSYSTQKRDRM
jgi:hypothetical protein